MTFYLKTLYKIIQAKRLLEKISVILVFTHDNRLITDYNYIQTQTKSPFNKIDIDILAQ